MADEKKETLTKEEIHNLILILTNLQDTTVVTPKVYGQVIAPLLNKLVSISAYDTTGSSTFRE